MTAMAQPKASDGRYAAPEEDHDLLARVATAWTPGSGDLHVEFLAACKRDAETHGGVISVIRVRVMLGSLNIPAHRFAALWSHYTGIGKPMKRLGRWEPCTGSASRNNGKPYPLRRWIG